MVKPVEVKVLGLTIKEGDDLAGKAKLTPDDRVKGVSGMEMSGSEFVAFANKMGRKDIRLGMSFQDLGSLSRFAPDAKQAAGLLAPISDQNIDARAPERPSFKQFTFTFADISAQKSFSVKADSVRDVNPADIPARRWLQNHGYTLLGKPDDTTLIAIQTDKYDAMIDKIHDEAESLGLNPVVAKGEFDKQHPTVQ